MQFTATIIAARRGGVLIQFCRSPRRANSILSESVSENDVIFCNPKYWIAKMTSFSLTDSERIELGIELAPRRGERQK
jgi:hypothetical protein